MSALTQVDIVVEVIVVDDGSLDDPASALGDLDVSRLMILRQDASGAASARNTGVRKANGEYIAFLDADDVWAGNRLSRAMEVLHNSTGPTMSFARMQEFLDPGLSESQTAPPLVRTLSGPSASTLVIHRKDFERVGPFDESLRTGEFIDWYSRAIRHGVCPHLDEDVLAQRRIHDANRDRWKRPGNRDYARLLLRKVREEQGR